MSKKTKRRKGLKIFIAVFLFLLAAAYAVYRYMDSMKEKIIKEKIIAAVGKKNNGLYSATIEKLKYNQVSHSISIINMVIVFDTVKYAELVKDHNAPPVLLKMTFPRIILSGLKTPLKQLKNRMEANKLQVIDPQIELIRTNEVKDSIHKVTPKELYKEILGDWDLASFDMVLVNHANFIKRNSGSRKDSVVFSDINLSLSSVQVDSLSNLDTTRILFAKDLNAGCEKISWFSSSRLYHYDVDDLKFSTKDKVLSLEHFLVEPQLSEVAYAKAMQYQSDRFDVSLNKVSIKNVDPAMIRKEELWAGKLEVGNSSIKVYRDLAYPRDGINRSGTYPHQQLMHLPLPIKFSTATFSNVFISYREKNDISLKVGEVRFNNSNFQVTNLCNIPSEIAKDVNCHINASTHLLNILPVSATLNLALGDPEGKFTIEGSTGSGLELSKLNDLLLPMGMTKIKAGHLNSVQFSLRGYNYRADGSMKGLYNGLDIEFLEMGDNMSMNKKHFGSLVANMVIKGDNPDKHGTRLVEIHHMRDMNRSFYNLVWKSIFEGMNKTLGIKRPMKKP